MLKERVQIPAKSIWVFSVWWVPAKKGKTVDQALGDKTFLAVVVHAHVTLTLAQLLALRIEEEREMSKSWRV